jgi:hypothetical protein
MKSPEWRTIWQETFGEIATTLNRLPLTALLRSRQICPSPIRLRWSLSIRLLPRYAKIVLIQKKQTACDIYQGIVQHSKSYVTLAKFFDPFAFPFLSPFQRYKYY